MRAEYSDGSPEKHSIGTNPSLSIGSNSSSSWEDVCLRPLPHMPADITERGSSSRLDKKMEEAIEKLDRMDKRIDNLLHMNQKSFCQSLEDTNRQLFTLNAKMDEILKWEVLMSIDKKTADASRKIDRVEATVNKLLQMMQKWGDWK